MNCPVCNGESRVLRTTDEARRRECARCHHRWNTVEVSRDDHERHERTISKMREIASDVLAETKP